MAKVINDANIAEVLASGKPVVIDFWATWCGPCRALAPVLAQLAKEYDGKVTVAKCDIEECEDIAVEYGIRSVPTLIFFKNGEPVDKMVGAAGKGKIQEKIDALL